MSSACPQLLIGNGGRGRSLCRRSCAYLVGCEKMKAALVIDLAGDEHRILEEAAKRSFTIEYVVNTHSHADHILGNKRMQELTGATTVIHELEAYALAHQSPDMLKMFIAEPSPPAGRTVKDGGVIAVGEVSLFGHSYPGSFPRRYLPLQ